MGETGVADRCVQPSIMRCFADKFGEFHGNPK